MEDIKQGCTIMNSPIKMTVNDDYFIFDIGTYILRVPEGFNLKSVKHIQEALDCAYKLGFSDCSQKILNKENGII